MPEKTVPSARLKAGIARDAPTPVGELRLHCEGLADDFARIACKTIFAALAGDAPLLDRMRRRGKYTRQFHTLVQARATTPPTVAAWIQKNLAQDGVISEAVASELRIALQRHTVSGFPGNGSGESEAPMCALTYVRETDGCDPLCPPPFPPK